MNVQKFTATLSFWFYLLCFLFLLPAGLNLFLPVTMLVGALVLVLAPVLAAVSTRWMPLQEEDFLAGYSNPSARWVLGVFIAFFVTFFVFACSRQTQGVDPNVYYLPMARLMNVSRWYPGIVALSNHFGFPNGLIVGASSFTSFGVIGLENAYSMLFWGFFGVVLFGLLLKKLPWVVATAFALGILFTNAFVMQAYNMGTDLPQAVMIIAGLWLWKEDRLTDAALVLGFSACFKQMGQFAYGLCGLYILVTQPKLLFSPKLIFSYALVFISVLRVFVGTGLPVFPCPVDLYQIPSWGVDQDAATALTTELRGRPKVVFTLTGLADFFFRFFVRPKTVLSGSWYSPVLAAVAACWIGCWFSARGRKALWSEIKSRSGILLIVTGLLLLMWLVMKPMFRYGAGAWTFLYLFLLLSVWPLCNKWVRRGLTVLIILWAVATTGYQTWRAADWMLPRAFRGERTQYEMASEVIRKKEYNDSLVLKHTSDGLPYLYTDGYFMGTWPMPIITRPRSIGDHEEIIRKFYRYNPDYRPDFEAVIARERDAGMMNATIE